MSEDILKRILQEIGDEEIAEYQKISAFKPSLRHKLAMKRIFARFKKNMRKAAVSDTFEPVLTVTNKHRRLSTRLLIIIAAVVCAVLLTGFMIVYFSKAFHGTVFSDNTQIFAVDTENCLTTIEYKYYLPELPEGFEQVKQVTKSTDVDTIYKNEPLGLEIMFSQYTKNCFSPHYNTEHQKFEEIEINGHNGLCLDFSDNEHNHSLIVWDNEDYILEISGDLSKNDTIILAKTAEISEN